MADRSKRNDGSLGDRVTSEHRQLDTLFRSTRASLDSSTDQGEAEEVFGRLQEAVDGHLAQEDRLYYPPIWALRPEYKDTLEALLGAHDDFRARLAEIASHLARGARAAALAGFDAFVEDFGRHEAGEERVLEQIERELPAPG
jgi:Hemerythrin HHE cation binding domain